MTSGPDVVCRSRRLVDLSHTIEHGMTTYAGLPPPVVSDYLSREESRARYSPGTEFHIGRIEMVANTGTYIDAPFHRDPGGKDIGELPLGSVADLEGVTVRALWQRSIGPKVLGGVAVRGKAVLVQSGWAEKWGSASYFEGHSYLTRPAVELLVEAGAALVGIDSLNIDDTRDGTRPAHTLLLRAGIPVVEHLCNLEAVPERGFRFFAVPAPVRGMGSFPVRAFAIVAESAT